MTTGVVTLAIFIRAVANSPNGIFSEFATGPEVGMFAEISILELEMALAVDGMQS